MAVAAAALVVGLVACAAGVQSRSPGGSEPARFETVYGSATSGLHERRREVVRDEAAWEKLWTEIHEHASPAPERPPVDFARRMLIVLATGSRPSGGYAIAARSVTRQGETLQVAVHESCPARGAMVSMGLTQPVAVVAVERVGREPEFEETRDDGCR
jgi:hypothetical protein